MKKYATLLILLLLGNQYFGQLANLVIFTELEENFSLTLDGQRINRLPARNLKVTGLEGGSLALQVQFANPMLANVIDRVQVVPGRELTLAIAKDVDGTLRLKFVNEFALDFVPVPPANQMLVAFGGGGSSMSTTSPVQPAPVQPNTLAQSPSTNPPTQVAPLPNTPPDPLPGYAGKRGCEAPMGKEAFEEAKKTISAKSFSDTKLQVAKQVARSNCLLTTQVMEIMALLTFDTDKLSFAKEAYDFTYDQSNYYKINSGFGYESTIRELEQYLNGK